MCLLLRLQGFGEILPGLGVFLENNWRTTTWILCTDCMGSNWFMSCFLPANQQAINEQQYVGMELFIFNAYAMIVGPIGEELVFPRFVDEESWKNFHFPWKPCFCQLIFNGAYSAVWLIRWHGTLWPILEWVRIYMAYKKSKHFICVVCWFYGTVLCYY